MWLPMVSEQAYPSLNLFLRALLVFSSFVFNIYIFTHLFKLSLNTDYDMFFGIYLSFFVFCIHFFSKLLPGTSSSSLCSVPPFPTFTRGRESYSNA